jgi:hypothetical protein
VRRVGIWSRLARGSKDPTRRQKEAYARFSHTLAAAAVIGAITLLFAEAVLTTVLLFRMAGLATGAVVCFVVGVLLLEGD